jgi:hypothetical protein
MAATSQQDVGVMKAAEPHKAPQMRVGTAEPRAGGRFGFTVFDGNGRVVITFEEQVKAEQARS